MLLEIILAIALLTVGGATILGALSQGVRSLERTRWTQHAADLAKSAMAKIEAGIESPRSLHGPVAAWEAEQGGVFADSLPDDSGWELEVEFEASQFNGLTSVSIRAVRRDAARPGRVLAEHTLRQLVRLGSAGENRAGEQGDLGREVERSRERSRP